MENNDTEKDRRIDKAAFTKYLFALLLFGLNGIVASHILLSSHEIVFLRTMIGSMLLIILFLIGRGRFHIRENRRDAFFIILSGMAMARAGCFFMKHISRSELVFPRFCITAVR